MKKYIDYRPNGTFTQKKLKNSDHMSSSYKKRFHPVTTKDQLDRIRHEKDKAGFHVLPGGKKSHSPYMILLCSLLVLLVIIIFILSYYSTRYLVIPTIQHVLCQ